MPRQRMIRPEIWTDEGFLSLTIPARLLFIGMISGADDEGRGLATDRCLKARVFPGDDITLEHMTNLRDEVVANMQVQIVENEGREYYELLKWNNHQTINRPQKSNISITDESMNAHDQLIKGIKEKKEVVQSVTLTDSELEKLKKEYGEDKTNAALSKLSLYKLSSGRTYKSDYYTILRWVMKEVLKEAKVDGPRTPTPGWECAKCHHVNTNTGGVCVCGEVRE
jgi:hypothetical protein